MSRPRHKSNTHEIFTFLDVMVASLVEFYGGEGKKPSLFPISNDRIIL
jgi:hypothetical protein